MINMPALKDRTGKRYGRLVVTRRAPNKGKRVCWYCDCDCGTKDVIVTGDSLHCGDTKSCGCLNTETRSKLGRSHLKDLVGQRFGQLVVLEEVPPEERTVDSPAWKCQCDCGKITIVKGNNLYSGNTISCGHHQLSKGELLIEQILKEFDISFINQYTFVGCKDILPLPFDFYLPDYNCCIEYDGKQHFEKCGSWDFEICKKHDNIKNQYCKQNNIKIIRIPYWDKDKINKEYIFNMIKE